MNEAEISDEDKADSEILRNIYQKTKQRANAALTPDEKAVLAKYGLHRNPDFKNIGDNHGNSIFSRPSDVFSYYNDFNMANNPKVNLADRARKMGARVQKNKELVVSQYHNTDSTDQHDKEFVDSKKYQRMTNVANSAKMQSNVTLMKNALNGRKFADNALRTIDADVEKRRQQGLARHNDAMAYIDNDVKWRRNNYIDSKQRNQKTIDKLLKRNTDDSLGSAEVDGKLESVQANEAFKRSSTTKKKDSLTDNNIKCKQKVHESFDDELSRYQKWIDFDIANSHKVLNSTQQLLKKAGFGLIKDQKGNYQVVSSDD